MKIFLLLIGAYLLGNMLTGSIVSRLFYKKEIRVEGSGNPGARNAGRLFGKKAFVATFLGDALKGVLAVVAARWLGFGMVGELLALIAVTMGHMYPALFKFRGGKGMSTFIGGLLVFNPVVFAIFAGIFLLSYPFTKSFTVAGHGCRCVAACHCFGVWIRSACFYRDMFVVGSCAFCTS